MKKIPLLFSFLFLLGIGSLSAQVWTQVGSDIDGETSGDRSGVSVSLSVDGKRLAIGSGNIVRVYSESGSAWSQLGNIGVPGQSVSLSVDGKRLAIGCNIVRVYSESGGVWSQLGSDMISGNSISLSADGKRLAIGNVFDFTGYVRVYSESGGVWSQLGSDINGEAANDYSGSSVSLSADGKRLAIGAPGNDGNGNEAGHVRVYLESGGVWSQLGSDIDGETSNSHSVDHAGTSVSLSADGKRLAIGAPGKDAGQVRVYSESGGAWSQLGSGINGEAAGEHSGHSVSLSADGKRLAIGAPFNNNVDGWYGHVRVYSESGTIWSQMGYDIDGEGLYDESGTSVSLSADGIRLAIGAPENGTDYFAGIIGAGHVRVYESPCTATWYADTDGDGYGNASSSLTACVQPAGFVLDNSDCNDTNVAVYPLAAETCNGLDDNCDGNIPAAEVDSDGDGYLICQNDCNDENATIHPGSGELCNTFDDDCDGLVNEGCGATLTVDAGTCQVVYYGYAPQACTTLTAVVAGGITPYSYAWSNGGTSGSISACPNATSVYSVTVTDHVGATAVNGVTVEVEDVHCGNNNDKVLVCHNPGSNSNTLCVASSAVSEHLAHGDYLGACGTSSPCSGGSNQSLIVEHVDSASDASRYPFQHAVIKKHEDEVSFIVIPNPANDHIEVHTNLVPVTIKLMDINGKVILHQHAIGYENSISTALLSDGIYFIRLESKTYCHTESIIIMH